MIGGPMRRFNWKLWSGLALIILGALAYFVIFVRFPVTRDVPWAPALMFLAGIALLIAGWRRAPRKTTASIVAALGLLVIAFFSYYVSSTGGLPPSSAAPAVGHRAPDFTLPDANGTMFRLADALAANDGVLLIFYRGYW